MKKPPSSPPRTAAAAPPARAARAATRRRAPQPDAPPPGAPSPDVLPPEASDEAGLDACRRWRAPRHERGERRVDAILDAASALLVEGGLSAVSVDAVARRSATSKSSMYHFFPDRDAIIHALADRHVATLEHYDGFQSSAAVAWADLTVEEAVDQYLQPFVRYAAEHPDVLPCMRAAARLAGRTAAEAVLDAMALERAEAVVRARQPGARAAERRERAATLYAVTVGTMDALARIGGGPPSRAAIRQLRTVLVGYLALLEGRGAAR